MILKPKQSSSGKNFKFSLESSCSAPPLLHLRLQALSLSLSLNTMLCILSSHWPQLERVYMASDLACRKKIGKSSTMPFPTPCYACSLLIGHSKKMSTWHPTWHVGWKSAKSVPRCLFQHLVMHALFSLATARKFLHGI
jgi:hypothetical protein